MRINFNPKITFKANADSVKPQQPQSGTVVTNPVQNQNAQELQNVTPSYNVKTPQKYTALGKIELPSSMTASIYKLENGQRVVIVPKKGPTIVKTYVNVGSMNEPDRVRGISHFIEHNLFNGSEGLEAGEFFATVNKMGANTNASTSFSATDYYIESNLLKKKDLETEVKIHASMIETPRFAEEMLKKEKGPVTSEINMILDDPENVATNTTLKTLYNINSTSKDIIGGTVDNINHLTREDVLDYYRRNYYPENMTTVITGEVEPEQAMALVSKYFQSRSPRPQTRNYEQLTPLQHTVRNDLTSDKTKATIISLGFSGPKNTDTRDKILMDAFQFFLVGSTTARLNKSLNEIQTNAFVSTERMSAKPEDSTVVLFSTQTSEDNSEKAIRRVFDSIANLEKDPPTEQELNIVKKKLKLNLAQVFESSSTVNTVIGTSMLDNDLGGVAGFEQVIDNLTSQQIVDFAKKYFDTNKCAITVIHPASANSVSSSVQCNQNKNHPSFTGKVDEINPKEAIEANKISRYGITNNFSVVTNDIDKNLAVFDLSLSADAPADVKPGVSNILGIMLNRGSRFKDEKNFFAELENQGIQTSFDANRREILVNSMFLPSDGVNAVKSTKEVLLNPRFTQEDFDYAKNFLKETVQNIPKNSQEAMLKEMFKDQFYGTTSEDVLKNIDGIKLSDVMGLYQYIMKNAQGQIVISAPFSKNPELKGALLGELCTGFPVLKPSTPNLFNSYVPVQDAKVVTQNDNKSQAEIQMGYKFKTNNNLKDAVTFELLNTILGGTPSSRLFQDLREQQKLAYRVNSNIGYFDNSGVLSMYIKTTTDDPQTGEISYDNLQKSVDGFKSHAKRLKDKNVSDDELENAKLTLKNKILNYSELTSDKNLSILLGLKSPYGVSADNKQLEIIDKITPEDIRAAANYMLNSNPTISIVATKNTLDNNKSYLSSQGTLVNC